MLYDPRSNALIKPVLAEQPLDEAMLDAMADQRGQQVDGHRIHEVIVSFFDAPTAERWLEAARKRGVSVRITVPGEPVVHLFRATPTLSDEA